jgi:5'-nucleotidase
MTMLLIRLAPLLLAAACSLPATAPTPAPGERVALRLIGFNDFHGNLESSPGLVLNVAEQPGVASAPRLRVPAGSGAALGGLVKSLRAGSPHSLVLAGGDLVGAAPLVSSLFRHESTIEVLNDVGLEVSSFGNHEFDEGTGELERLVRGGCLANKPDALVTSCARASYPGTRFTYLGANVLGARDGKPITAPYVIKTFGGVRVGIIGAVTKQTPTLVMPTGVAGLTFMDEAPAVNRAADELRAKGVRAMVAVFHEGMYIDPRADWNDTACPGKAGPLLVIARALAPEIRVVFSGHTHAGYRCEFEGRLLVQSSSYGRGLSVVDVELDRGTGEMLPPVRSMNLPVMNERTEPEMRAKVIAGMPEPFARALAEARPDAGIAEKVAAYAALAKPRAERVVARIGGAFPHSRSERTDTAAGRLVADAQLAAARALGAQFALMNSGGVRVPGLVCASPPCPVTFGQVFTMQPFGNSIVVMNLTGEQVKRALEQQHRPGAEPYFLHPSAELTFTWDNNAPRGEQVVEMRLNGQPLDPAKTYRVAVNSFLADGGDGFSVLKEGRDLKGAGQDLDALMAYLAAGERSPSPKQRITRRS